MSGLQWPEFYWNMEKIYFTPGPSQLLQSVPKYIREAVEQSIPSLSHRSGDFRSIFRNTSTLVKKVLGAPDDMHVFFMGSATEAMERVIQNCAEKYSFHFVNGAFSKRFHKIAMQLGKTTQMVESPLGKPIDFSAVKIPSETELICITQNETSIGIAIDPSEIHNIKRRFPNKLLVVDIVSSAPYPKLDFSLVDMAFFSVQKCFGLPAGLGVLLVNEKAMQKSKSLLEKGISIGSFHNFQWMAEEEAKDQTPETPNVLGIYLLGRVCNEFLQRGMDKLREDSDEKAAMLYDFFDKHPTYRPFVDDKAFRSKTVITIDIPGGSSQLIAKLKEQGLIVGSGYGEFKERQVRIANFPAHSEEQIKKLLFELSQYNSQRNLRT